MGVTQFMNCVEMFLGPAMVAYFVQDETNKNQWIPVYAIMSGCMIIASLIFLKYSSVHPPSYIADGNFVKSDSESDDEQKKRTTVTVIPVDTMALSLTQPKKLEATDLA